MQKKVMTDRLRVKLFACWVILRSFLSSADLLEINFFQKILRNTCMIRVSNSLDPDWDPDLLSSLIWV